MDTEQGWCGCTIGIRDITPANNHIEACKLVTSLAARSQANPEQPATQSESIVGLLVYYMQ